MQTTGLVLEQAMQTVQPVVDSGLEYVSRITETEAWTSAASSGFGRGLKQVYDVWKQGLDAIVQGVKCMAGYDGPKCGEVEKVWRDLRDYVSGKREEF